MPQPAVRTRFAPSPTGYLHVGGARTALFNYLYAKTCGGKFILRIEDTDQARSTEESYHQVLDSMRWLGMSWDEGPELENQGPYGPYRQSERREIYDRYASDLVTQKKAFRCFCTQEELEKKKAQREAMGLPPVYDGKCRNLSDDEIQTKLDSGLSYAIRFRTHDTTNEVVVQDMVQGNVRFDTSLIGDFIIVKSDGFPSYNYAVVVDDHEMQITHVIRGVGHLSNTPRQIMIYNAFGWAEPAWAHVSEIVGSDHKKLSKRHGATAITAFRELGYPASAFINYMALLGWSTPDGEEYKSVAELEKIFDVSRCNKSPSMFDVFDLSKTENAELSGLSAVELEPYLFAKSKMNWLSNRHIRALDEEQFITDILPFVKEVGVVPENEVHANDERLRSVLLSLRVYLDYYMQIRRYLPDFYTSFDPGKTWNDAAMEWVKHELFLSLAKEFLRLIQTKGNEEITQDDYKEYMNTAGKTIGAKGKNLFMNLRVAATGRTEGLELPVYLVLLGKERVIERLTRTIETAEKL